MRGSRHLLRIGVFEISLRVKGVRELRLLLLVIDYTQRLSQAEARASRKFLARVANSVSCKVRMRVNGRGQENIREKSRGRCEGVCDGREGADITYARGEVAHERVRRMCLAQLSQVSRRHLQWEVSA